MYVLYMWAILICDSKYSFVQQFNSKMLCREFDYLKDSIYLQSYYWIKILSVGEWRGGGALEGGDVSMRAVKLWRKIKKSANIPYTGTNI